MASEKPQYGNYSKMAASNGFVFMSGQVAFLNAAKKTPFPQKSIKRETAAVMDAIRSNLNEVGLDMKDIVKVSIFMRDMKDYDKINEVYISYFEGPPPAREAVAVAALPFNVNVEISVIAAGK